MKRSTIALALAAASTIGMVGTTEACSRITLDTPYGVSTVRSLDWETPLGSVAVVHPVGVERTTRAIENSNYANPAKWVTKYQTMAIEERNLFHGSVAEAINLEGLSASVLYQDDSRPFIKDHKDTGAAAVSLKDISTYIAENFKTVESAVSAFRNGDFIQAWRDGVDGSIHGLHLSIQDKSGAIALFELNEGGKMQVWEGDVHSKLRVMTNAPLQQFHDANVDKLPDLKETNTGYKIGSTVDAADRMLRGLYNTANVDFTGLSEAQVEAKFLGLFDSGNIAPQGIIDPTGDAHYPSWNQYSYNLETGSFRFKDFETYTVSRTNIKDIANIKTTSCADLVMQAQSGKTAITFTECK